VDTLCGFLAGAYLYAFRLDRQQMAIIADSLAAVLCSFGISWHPVYV
jgi:hypothetical protein